MQFKNCPVCGNTKASCYSSHDSGLLLYFYDCPVCGRYELDRNEDISGFNENHLASFLFYNAFLSSKGSEYRYYTVLPAEMCDKYNNDFINGNNTHGRPVHLDNNIVDSWYPRSFSERIDLIVKYIGTHIEHVGQGRFFSYFEMMSLLFVDRKEMTRSPIQPKLINRSEDECSQEATYMLDSLKDSGIISYSYGSDEEKAVYITLTPKGYGRFDELQKNNVYGKTVFVAMKFGDDTKKLREAIRKGITDSKHVAVFIDEIQHNDFITPEILKRIRDSKFVVVDLTHKNNGAYFEEGYAMGLGKTVIQLCKKKKKLHFDIAQKNTIIWETEEDIPDRLSNRIKATID